MSRFSNGSGSFGELGIICCKAVKHQIGTDINIPSISQLENL